MLQRINNIKNVGVFKEYSLDQTRHGKVEFGRTNIVYGKNSSGKSTLAGILRSLSKNDSEIIEGRRTIGSSGSKQRIELLLDHETYLFHGNWNKTYPNIAIFNQDYINDNIYLGDAISTDNRRNQFNIMVGNDNISTNLKLNEVNKQLREIAKEKKVIEVAIKSKLKGITSLDDYIKMDRSMNIESVNNELDRLIKQRDNYNSRAKINELNLLNRLEVPVFDLDLFRVILSSDNNQLLSSFEEKVKSHMDRRGIDIAWIETGYERSKEGSCPYCNQSLDRSDIFQAYKEYFNINLKEYSNKIRNMDSLIRKHFSRDKALECNLLLVRNQKLYNEIKLMLNIEKNYTFERNEIGNRIIDLFHHIYFLMSEKTKNPFRQIDYHTEVYNLNREYKEVEELVKDYNIEINDLNQKVNEYRIGLKSFDIRHIEREIDYYKNLAISKDRENMELISKYNVLNQKIHGLYNTKLKLKDEISKINNRNIKKFNETLNNILDQLNANFKVHYLYPKFNDYGIEANYKLLLRHQEVQTKVTKKEIVKIPNFKNTLSGGEKNLLALAYFITDIKMSPSIDNKIIVFDDPTNYSDNNNKSLIAEQILKLSKFDNQIIVLTHDIEFSKKFWELSLSSDLVGLYIDYNDGSSEIITRDIYRERKYVFA